ncbi:cobalamin biosynthesis protein CobG [Streptomyces sp. NBC_00690]|uniref:cobalamin biosynthesis protein CobG n=1 Tax=Streptomyces sp. NBC_00690 TaxID=2975808 RepID=UPI002E28BD53|nr:cobalamin biosynthesis protein CobG [Streptomyces sp. NBC_00690]
MLADMPTSPRPAQAGATGTTPSGVRGDACPGSLRLHRADDGALARIRIPGGVLRPAQAEALLTAARRLGDGELHLTSRGNVQLRGLGEQCGGELAQLLGNAGLLPSATHERVRNVVASPLAGLDGLDGSGSGPGVRGWLRALDELLCASARAAALSGRFLFALDDGRGDVDALRADVTLLAAGTSGRTARDHDGGAGLRIGDSDDVLLLSRSDDAPRAALLCAETFLDAADLTPEAKVWRVRDLPDTGARLREGTLARLAKAGIPLTGIRRHPRRETATPPPYGIVTPPDPRPTPTPPVPPTPPSVSFPSLPSLPSLLCIPRGPSGPAEAIRPSAPAATSPAALSIGAPLGRLTGPQWERLTSTARKTPDGELRLTPWRGVIVTGMPGDQAGSALDELAATGLITTADSPWNGVGACIGMPGCAKSSADVRAMAEAVVSWELPSTAGRFTQLPVYWSGCERRCGRPPGDRVDALATPDGSFRVTRVCGDPPPVAHGTTVPTDTSAAALAHTVAHARRPR